MTSAHWVPPPAELSLARDKVHVWRAALDLPSSCLRDLERTLSEDEVERADRFRFERDRRRFVAARGTLRTLLGRYLGIDPCDVRFRYGEHGKPALESPSGETGLRFNVAHAEDLALYAFACGREVGVDLERVRPISEAEQIARRFFSARERATLARVAPDQRPEAFYACWTRKEAYVKARGEGLSFPLDQFDVSLAPGEPAKLLDVRFARVDRRPAGDDRELERWSMQAISPAPGYAAALVVEGAGWVLLCWQTPVAENASDADATRVLAAIAQVDTTEERS